jgi:hypothetical protein
MSLDARQERQRRSVFNSALENWRLNSDQKAQESIKRGRGIVSDTRLSQNDASRRVQSSMRQKQVSSAAPDNDPNKEIAAFLGSWSSIIDEEFGGEPFAEDEERPNLGEDSKSTKPPRVTQREADDGMFMPFDLEEDMDNALTALGTIESSKDYSALGPVITIEDSMYYGDRAHGYYQVMGNNIGPWTKKYLGKEMTKEDFLSDTEAQDKLAKTFLTEEYKKHGTIEDAISVWFTGSPLAKAKKRGAADQNISVNEYVERWRQGYVKLLEG